MDSISENSLVKLAIAWTGGLGEPSVLPINLPPYLPTSLSPYLPISLSPYLPISLSPYHQIRIVLFCNSSKIEASF